MRASHLRKLIYDLKYLGAPKYDGDSMDYKPTKIIMDNDAAIFSFVISIFITYFAYTLTARVLTSRQTNVTLFCLSGAQKYLN